ncbi:MAG: NAD(P)-dependent dehydrogenase (short-subunit alcohol dehydrogenase family) [Gammaproteobacteria bacterium]|jgi:NAD(P)-dependent dehydrogenase (short-subunit alcohol dehydrogenase family)
MESGNRLAGKVAIVSGAASGIGAETARLFAAHGAKVVACDVNEAGGNATVEAITAAGGAAIFRLLNVADEQQWNALVAETEASFGQLNILANIAGISGRDPDMKIQTTATAGARLAEQSLENWNQIMDINATGTFLGTKSAIPAMIRAGGGSIVNISSICGLVGSHGNAAYHASKGAVRILSKAAAVQYGPEGVRVNSVHPGFIDTAMTRPAHDNNAIAQKRMDATPIGRFGQPIDIAMGCLYLASDESSFVTGTELVIDGGMVAN